MQDADEAYDEFALPMNFDFGLTGQVFGDDAMGLVGGLNMANFLTWEPKLLLVENSL